VEEIHHQKDGVGTQTKSWDKPTRKYGTSIDLGK
jgi:hypothetical protein